MFLDTPYRKKSNSVHEELTGRKLLGFEWDD